MDDIAVLVAEAIARRVKEGRARQALATPGAAAPPAASVAKPPAGKASAAKPAPPAAKAAAAPPPRPAPPRPVPPAAGGDDFFAMPLDAPHVMATVPLLEAFSSAPALLAAFVLHEALGKPVALRDDGGTFPGPLRSNE